MERVRTAMAVRVDQRQPGLRGGFSAERARDALSTLRHVDLSREEQAELVSIAEWLLAAACAGQEMFGHVRRVPVVPR